MPYKRQRRINYIFTALLYGHFLLATVFIVFSELSLFNQAWNRVSIQFHREHEYFSPSTLSGLMLCDVTWTLHDGDTPSEKFHINVIFKGLIIRENCIHSAPVKVQIVYKIKNTFLNTLWRSVQRVADTVCMGLPKTITMKVSAFGKLNWIWLHPKYISYLPSLSSAIFYFIFDPTTLPRPKSNIKYLC
jgi:hypothetical protein